MPSEKRYVVLSNGTKMKCLYIYCIDYADHLLCGWIELFRGNKKQCLDYEMDNNSSID